MTETVSIPHTPGPWEYDGKFTVGIPHASGLLPFRVMPEDARLIVKAPDLLASCKELREALAGAMRVIATHALREGLTDCDALTDAFVAEMTRLDIAPGVGVRADDLIAQVEGRPRRVPIDLDDLTL